VILPKGEVVPYVVAGPQFMERGASQAPYGGNFTWRDEFDSGKLNDAWLNVRVPKTAWADLDSRRGALTIHAFREPLSTSKNPSFLGRRQQHMAFDAVTAMRAPAQARVAAGMAVFQAEKNWFFFGVRQTSSGLEVFLEKPRGTTPETVAHAIAATANTSGEAQLLMLRVSANGGSYSFSYDLDGKGWRPLRSNEDGTLLSTTIAGGFTGVVLGPYARAE
jgi:xylan 1,4-beta-xylosidase